MSKLFGVSYEGYMIVSAETMDEAGDIANKMLSDSGIINDGYNGEWALTDIAEQEE